MAKVVQISEAGPLSNAQVSEYKTAKEKIADIMHPCPSMKRDLTEGSFLETKGMLERLIKGEEGRQDLFRNQQRDFQITQGVGIEKLQEYLTATNRFLDELREADEFRASILCKEELETVRKYEFRYNKYHKNDNY